MKEIENNIDPKLIREVNKVFLMQSIARICNGNYNSRSIDWKDFTFNYDRGVIMYIIEHILEDKLPDVINFMKIQYERDYLVGGLKETTEEFKEFVDKAYANYQKKKNADRESFEKEFQRQKSKFSNKKLDELTKIQILEKSLQNYKNVPIYAQCYPAILDAITNSAFVHKNSNNKDFILMVYRNAEIMVNEVLCSEEPEIEIINQFSSILDEKPLERGSIICTISRDKYFCIIQEMVFIIVLWDALTEKDSVMVQSFANCLERIKNSDYVKTYKSSPLFAMIEERIANKKSPNVEELLAEKQQLNEKIDRLNTVNKTLLENNERLKKSNEELNSRKNFNEDVSTYLSYDSLAEYISQLEDKNNRDFLVMTIKALAPKEKGNEIQKDINERIAKNKKNEGTTINANSVSMNCPSLQQQNLNFNEPVDQVVGYADYIQTKKNEQ